ncbi:MAG: PilZ domain-containing protein [Candidatus Omnitrophica bacterium]|nr:PilZ domain-containing protein [Candidatus Omnitrophota bacterium]
MDENKRKTTRFSFTQPVAYSQAESILDGSLAGNISLGGMSLKVQSFMAVGTILELQLHLNGLATLVKVQAEVVRIREALSADCYEIGLKFIRDEGSMRAIGKYIQEHHINQHKQ